MLASGALCQARPLPWEWWFGPQTAWTGVVRPGPPERGERPGGDPGTVRGWG